MDMDNIFVFPSFRTRADNSRFTQHVKSTYHISLSKIFSRLGFKSLVIPVGRKSYASREKSSILSKMVPVRVILSRTRQIMRYRATAILQRPQLPQMAGVGGVGVGWGGGGEWGWLGGINPTGTSYNFDNI